MAKTDKPDLILLDIKLAGKKTGIDVAETLNKDFDIPFIFLTSNSDIYTIDDAKKVYPSAFLVKPFNREDLFAAIEIALSNFNYISKQIGDPEKIRDFIFVKKRDAFYSVKLSDILYLKSDHVYIDIFTDNDVFTIRSSFDQFFQKINNKSFIQTNRRYIINVDHLKSINNDTVLIKDHEIPLSKSHKAELMKIAALF
jgi:DNA-binding LytR/AlgR family response regulator